MIVRLGTRGSQLALFQTRCIADALRAIHPGLRVEIEIIQTNGDRVLDAPLPSLGGKGVFTQEIESALLERRIDLAVHSLKDLPTTQPDGLALSAIPKRESPRDVLVAARPIRLSELGADQPVGTSSLRRSAQLLAKFPRLAISEIRGNVPTRVKKLLDGRYAAIVLAEAGLNRLGLVVPFKEILNDDVMIPAPGQGALGLQIRASDDELAELLAPLADAESTHCVTAERVLLDRLGGGCQLPLGACAEIDAAGMLRLRARVVSPDGRIVIESELTGPRDSAGELGIRMAEELLAKGAADLIASLDAIGPGSVVSLNPTKQVLAQEPCVLVTRDEDADGPLSRALRSLRMDPVCLPLIRTRPARDLSPLRALARDSATFDALILTSANAVEALLLAVPNAPDWLGSTAIFCPGEATAEKLGAAGFANVIAGDGDRASMLERFAAHFAGRSIAELRVLYLKGDLAPAAIGEQIVAWGCQSTTLVAYESHRVMENAELTVQLIESHRCQAVSFCSSSAAEAFAQLIPDSAGLLAKSGVLLASIGGATSDTIRETFAIAPVEAEEAEFASLAACIAKALTARDSSVARKSEP